jgi:hypothetical protein
LTAEIKWDPRTIVFSSVNTICSLPGRIILCWFSTVVKWHIYIRLTVYDLAQAHNQSTLVTWCHTLTDSLVHVVLGYHGWAIICDLLIYLPWCKTCQHQNGQVSMLVQLLPVPNSNCQLEEEWQCRFVMLPKVRKVFFMDVNK